MRLNLGRAEGDAAVAAGFGADQIRAEGDGCLLDDARGLLRRGLSLQREAGGREVGERGGRAGGEREGGGAADDHAAPVPGGGGGRRRQGLGALVGGGSQAG